MKSSHSGPANGSPGRDNNNNNHPDSAHFSTDNTNHHRHKHHNQSSDKFRASLHHQSDNNNKTSKNQHHNNNNHHNHHHSGTSLGTGFRSGSKTNLLASSSSPITASSLSSSSKSSSWSSLLLTGSGRLCTASVNLIAFVLTVATIVALLFSAISPETKFSSPQQITSLSSSSSSNIVGNAPDIGQVRQIESLPLRANVNEQELFQNLNGSLVQVSPLEAGEHRRVKRGVIYLGSMIKCITGCNPFLYKDYGCYCGFQGDGVPMDGIDSCCQQHDLCYERAECHQSLVYFTPYKWSCSSRGRAICSDINTPCSYQLCQCDRIFAKCLAKYPCPSEKADCFFPPPAMIFRKGIYAQGAQQPQTPAMSRRAGHGRHHYHRRAG